MMARLNLKDVVIHFKYKGFKVSNSIYIVSKPLQLSVSTIICNRLSSSELIIVDMFYNANGVFNAIKKMKIWNRVFFARNRFISFLVAGFRRPSELYIDGDIGTRLAFYLLIFRIISGCKNIYVYEEGIGTYRNNIYSEGLKKKVFDMLGISTYFGGSWFCRGVYVFDPDRYRNAHILKKDFEVKPINKSMSQHVQEFYEEIKTIYGFNDSKIGSGTLAEIYITSYSIDTELLSSLRNNDKDVYVKLHPQLDCYEYCDLYENIMFIDNGVPAEIVITILSRNYNNVKVFHHGSSVELYINYPNIEYVLV